MRSGGASTRRVTASRRALACAVGARLGFLAMPASADEQIETVVVTAQKRVEPIHEVPVSIAVVSKDALKAFDFNKTTDLPYLVPSLTLLDAAGPRDFGFFIRGIGTSTFAPESIEGSTAFVLDGVVIGEAGASLSDLPDIAQVEVLRGPQGTLFGTNASAGVVNITTRAPSDTLEENFGITWADPDNERKAYGVITGPITDDLKFLVSGRWGQTDGYIYNVYDGRHFNNQNNGGFRGKLEYTPTSNLDVTIIGDFYKNLSHCCIWTLRSVGSPPNAIEAIDLAAGIVPSADNRQTDIDGRVFSNEEAFGTSMQVDYRFGGGYTLTSITAWRRWLTIDGLDSDSTPLDLLDTNAGGLKQRQVSQELRVASPLGGFFDYVAGFYFYDQNVFSSSIQNYAPDLAEIPPSLQSEASLARLLDDDIDNTGSTRNIAMFGQANFHLTKQLHFILGGRLINESEAATKMGGTLFAAVADATGSRSVDAAAWKTGLQYDFTSNLMAFVTATRGFKGGGFDTDISFARLPYVRPEIPIDYEAGARATFPDQRLVFDATLFDDRVHDYQASGFNPLVNTFTIQNANATTRGVEFDGTWQPAPDVDWNLDLSGSYVDARWGDFPDAACFSGQAAAQGCVGGVQNLTGMGLPFSPKWQFELLSHYQTPLPGEPWNLSLDLGANYHTHDEIGFPNDPSFIQGGFALVNASVAVAGESNAWRVSVFVKNLTDQHYEIVAFPTPFGSAAGRSGFIPYEAQRIVGLSLDLAH